MVIVFYIIKFQVLCGSPTQPMRLSLYLCRCLGTRQLLDEADEMHPNGKVFKKWKLEIYTWLSYGDVDEMSNNLGECQ